MLEQFSQAELCSSLAVLKLRCAHSHTMPPPQAASRLLALRTGVNVFRLLRLLARHTGGVPVPLGQVMLRPRGVIITFKMNSIIKQIDDFLQQPNVNPDVNVLSLVGWGGQLVWGPFKEVHIVFEVISILLTSY
jgi:hypothetical protein